MRTSDKQWIRGPLIGEEFREERKKIYRKRPVNGEIGRGNSGTVDGNLEVPG